MSKPVPIDLFVEDRAHEEFLKPLITRIGEEEQVRVQVSVRTARGGHARALSEFRIYQRAAPPPRSADSWRNWW